MICWKEVIVLTRDDLCKCCGFPKKATREPVFISGGVVAFSQHLGRKCPECGHYQDGSTIEDDEIRREYGGPPKPLSQGGWKAEIQEGREYRYDSSRFRVLEERTENEQVGIGVKIEYTESGEEDYINLFRFEGKLAEGEIEILDSGDTSERS